jgi:hypothetical protein
MSTFSTRGGLYERAQKRFNVPDGKRLFTYAFFERQRLEAMVRAWLPFGPPTPAQAPAAMCSIWPPAPALHQLGRYTEECHASRTSITLQFQLSFTPAL